MPEKSTIPNSRGQKSKPRSVVFILLLILCVVVLAIAFFRIRNRRLRPVCGPELPNPDSVCWAGLALGKNDVLATALSRWGLSREFYNKVEAALARTDFNFRNMKEGDSVSFEYRGLHLASLTYHKNLVTEYRVTIDSLGQLTAEKVERPVDTVRTVVRGIISGSLWNTLIGMGEKPALVVNFAEILSYEVDFLTEVHDGDSFEILVDKYYVDSIFYRDGLIRAAHYNGKAGNYYGFYFRLPNGHWDYYNEKGQSLRKTVLRSPLQYAKVTSYFGNRFHPIYRVYRQHAGVDYAAPTGTPVSAIADGTVTMAQWHGGYGHLVEIKHAGGLSSRYGHLSRYGSGVKSGRRVRQGQTIGYVGTTGVSTGPHLHFEIRQNGKPVNPLKVIPPRAEPVPSKYMDDFNRIKDEYLAALRQAAGPLVAVATDSSP